MQRVALLAILLLAPVALAGAPQFVHEERLHGTYAAPLAGPRDDGRLLETLATFDLPPGASSAWAELSSVRRAPVEVASMFDVYLVAPSGEYRSVQQSGLSPLAVRGCWLGDVTCEFEGNSRSSPLPAEAGPWRLAYRGVFHGDMTFTVFAN